MSLKLSICIPTYNRAELLKMQLDALVESLRHVETDQCEIIISDNCSTDHTADVVTAYDGRLAHLQYHRNDSNLGPVKNILNLPLLAAGEFIWLLGDDDLVFPYALSEIFKYLNKYPEIDGFIASHLIEDEAHRDQVLANLKNGTLRGSRWLFSPDVEFDLLDRYEQIFNYTKGAAPLNFLSNVILAKKEWLVHGSEVRQHCESHEDLSDTITAGPHTCVWAKALVGHRVGVIKRPLVVGFIGNQGFLKRWDVLNFMYFLGMSDIYSELGADPQSVTKYRNATLRNRGALERLLTSHDEYTNKIFSLRKLIDKYGNEPELLKSLQSILFKSKSFKARLSVLFSLALAVVVKRRSVSAGLVALFAYDKMKIRSYRYNRSLTKLHDAAKKHFRSSVVGADDASVMHPIYLKNPSCIQLGTAFKSGPGLRLEAFEVYRDIPYSPSIIIGNNVCFNYNCHVGCINLIRIGNDVLIGSNVLITDHHHGKVDALDFSIPFCDQPLYSKGGVIIGNNVWIGENVCIMPGVEIGANSIIAANAVVTRSCPPYSLLAGIPAKVLKTLESPSHES